MYEQGDTLIFESETGTLDTTIILSKLTFYPDYNPIELHGKYHPQFGQIWYYNKNTPYINDGKELVYLAKNTPNQKQMDLYAISINTSSLTGIFSKTLILLLILTTRISMI